MPSNLTQVAVDRLTWAGRRQSIRDNVVRGLMVRVAQGGNSYALQREFRGKTCMLTLGPTDRHTLAQARAWARAQHVLFDQGIDPTVRAPAAPGVPTLAAAWASRLEHIRPRRRPATVENYAHFERYFADWADKPISQITRQDLKQRHNVLGHKPVQANRALKAFRETWNYVHNHLQEIGPCPMPKVDFFYEEKPKPKALDVGQLVAWGESIAKHPRRDMLLFMLFSGLRRRTETRLAD